MKNPVLLSAVRIPTGKFLGALAGLQATRLGAIVVAEAVRRAGIAPDQVDEVILGNVVGAGLGQNPARQAALGGGLPDAVPALTVNKVCGSGLKAVVLGAQAIRCGDAEIVVAGGMESMSNAPYLLKNARGGLRMGHQQLVDSVIHDGLWDAYRDYHMGLTGEVVAERYDVGREAQDQWALDSHRKAIAAIDAGKFAKEIVPVDLPQAKGDPVRFDTDESPRRETTIEALRKLKPAFRKDGTVTAGNAPGLSDGAAALVIASADAAKRLGRKPRAEIVAYASTRMRTIFNSRKVARRVFTQRDYTKTRLQKWTPKSRYFRRRHRARERGRDSRKGVCSSRFAGSIRRGRPAPRSRPGA